MDAIAAAAIHQSSNFRPQELANIGWAYAVLGGPDMSLLDSLASASMARMATFRAPDIANTAWAFETLSFANMPLFESIAEAAISIKADFNAQDLSNTVWAFAAKSFRHRSLLEAMAEQSITRASEFCAKEIAAMAWSVATLNFCYVPLLDAISAKAITTISEFDRHSLASTAWAFATLAIADQQLFEAIAATSLEKISDFNTQDLANTGWAFAVFDGIDQKLLETMAKESIPKLHEFRAKEVEMLIWSLARSDSSAAKEVCHRAGRQHKLRSLGLSALLCDAERRCDAGEQAKLFRSPVLAQQPGIYAGAAGLGATRLASAGFVSEALAELQTSQIPSSTASKAKKTLDLVDSVSLACGGTPISRFKGQDWNKERSKPSGALEFALTESPRGNPEEVCKSLERYAEEVLKPTRQWLKIAGGSKSIVVQKALDMAPESGACLEIGTYLGFTSLRFAMSRPESLVVTVEVEPEHAIVAQCLAAHAGVGHQVDVWIGHSRDVLSSLRDRYPGESRCPCFAVVFMDQAGSRFWQDLQTLLDEDLLLPGAVILADNVLKPGAPLFLWQMLKGDGSHLFQTDIVSLEEFGMAGVEDWMTVARYLPDKTSDPGVAGEQKTIPPEVFDLEWEANQVRRRAESGSGSVPFEMWAAFSEGMKSSLKELGIEATAYASKSKDLLLKHEK
eukprot:TRINITY_DN3204_c0_g1_i1.p1 TRINITY_DN3204_c0_g1~~TRINITY_DN3204_c0_g1_i1.p1  ORF type:complete len:679 (+),score=130.26 TRINITY_DN3204_c0_g1_i1:890-2926(+)